MVIEIEYTTVITVGNDKIAPPFGYHTRACKLLLIWYKTPLICFSNLVVLVDVFLVIFASNIGSTISETSKLDRDSILLGFPYPVDVDEPLVPLFLAFDHSLGEEV